MVQTYYCPRCGMMSKAPKCPRCKSATQRMLRVMGPEELIEQLTMFDEGVGGKRTQSRIRMRPQLQAIRGGRY